MDYRRFGDTVLVRMDKGEEILEQMQKVAEQENIRLAEVSALGAINDFTVGVFKTDEKKYYSNHFEGAFEITSLTGTISKGRSHLHITLSDDRGQCIGGHLERGCRIKIT